MLEGLRLQHVAGAGERQPHLAIGDQHHRLEPAQIAVHAPILGELHAGARQLSRILLELALEPLEQSEGVGRRAGEAGDHIALAEPAHLLGVRLDDGLPEAHLSVAGDDGLAALLHQDDGRRVPARRFRILFLCHPSLGWKKSSADVGTRERLGKGRAPLAGERRNDRTRASVQAIVEAARSMNALGLNQGTAGNISVRDGEAMLITPSGISYASMTPRDDRAHAARRRRRVEGPLAPSSEWRMHRDILRARADVKAVVHTHSTYATTLAALRREIPPVHYMIGIFRTSRIRCTDYAPFGTQALSDLAVEGLGRAHGVLLGNHGMIALGEGSIAPCGAPWSSRRWRGSFISRASPASRC